MTEPASDSELLARARNGDDDAFRLLVVRYEGVVAATVIGMLGRCDDAEDVGQETFIRFYRALRTYREESSLKTYLIRIAMNLSLNAIKRRKRISFRFISRDREDVAALEPSVAPAFAGDAAERRMIVQRAISMLSEKHRPVVVLRLLQEMSTRDTALALNVPEGTVLSRLSRGIQELAAILGPYMKNGELERLR